MPDFSTAEIVSSIPIILSLILIEGLLSVDNSLAIAALARRLPEEQRPRALTWGMAGAYGFRCLCLLFASFILGNRWVKLAGAIYLIYLMCKELTGEKDHHHDEAAEGADLAVKAPVARSFFSVVSGILVLDASLSVDNVVAAIAMSPKLWVVYVGVGIGILALRFVAGFAMKMIARYPILEQCAFLLVGFVGVVLICEMEFEFHLGPLYKFAGILVIMALCLGYEEVGFVKTILTPLVVVFTPIFKAIAFVIGIVLWPIAKLAHLVAGMFHRGEPEPSKG